MGSVFSSLPVFSEQERRQRLRLGVRHRTCWRGDRLGEAGQHLSIQGIGLGQLADHLGEVAHLALNLLRQERSGKIGVKAKRLTAAWDDAYRLKILAG